MTASTALRMLDRAHDARSHDDAWQEYAMTGSRQARAELVMRYAGLVRYVVAQLGHDMPGSVDFDDLAQAGFLGLMNAVDRFDPERGVKFETYAVLRIRGAIVDDLRAMDWAPRSVRAKARTLAQVQAQLEADLQRTPTTDEVAGALGASPAALAHLRDQLGRAKVGALDELLADTGDGDRPRLADTLADATVPDVDERLLEQETRATVRRALAMLPERDQQILVLSYVDQLTLRQIGIALGVTESRVCQLRTRALAAVRALLSTGPDAVVAAAN